MPPKDAVEPDGSATVKVTRDCRFMSNLGQIIEAKVGDIFDGALGHHLATTGAPVELVDDKS